MLKVTNSIELNGDLKLLAGEELTIECKIKSCVIRESKKRNDFAIIEVEDEFGELKFFLFGKTYFSYSSLLKTSDWIRVVCEISPKRFNKQEFEIKLKSIISLPFHNN